MCACTCVCVHVYVCLHLAIRVCVCAYCTCMYMCVCVSVHVYACVSICVYVHVYVSMCVCGGACMCRPEVDTECLPQSLSTLFYETGSHEAWYSPIWLGWLASRQQGSLCLRLPIATVPYLAFNVCCRHTSSCSFSKCCPC